jgi:hypothetical protein
VRETHAGTCALLETCAHPYNFMFSASTIKYFCSVVDIFSFGLLFHEYLCGYANGSAPNEQPTHHDNTEEIED